MDSNLFLNALQLIPKYKFIAQSLILHNLHDNNKMESYHKMFSIFMKNMKEGEDEEKIQKLKMEYVEIASDTNLLLFAENVENYKLLEILEDTIWEYSRIMKNEMQTNKNFAYLGLLTRGKKYKYEAYLELIRDGKFKKISRCNSIMKYYLEDPSSDKKKDDEIKDSYFSIAMKEEDLAEPLEFIDSNNLTEYYEDSLWEMAEKLREEESLFRSMEIAEFLSSSKKYARDAYLLLFRNIRDYAKFYSFHILFDDYMKDWRSQDAEVDRNIKITYLSTILIYNIEGLDHMLKKYGDLERFLPAAVLEAANYCNYSLLVYEKAIELYEEYLQEFPSNQEVIEELKLLRIMSSIVC